MQLNIIEKILLSVSIIFIVLWGGCYVIVRMRAHRTRFYRWRDKLLSKIYRRCGK
jgi:hypothetical protein